MPPELRLSLTPSPRTRFELPPNVRELGVTLPVTARSLTPTSRTLLFAETVVEYSLTWRGRTMRSDELTAPPPAVLFTVAKEVPKPVRVESTRAQGNIALLGKPVVPVQPFVVTPPAKTTLEFPGSLETPKLSPRNRTEAPRGSVLAAVVFCAGAMLSGAAQNTKFIRPALFTCNAFISRVIVEAPRANVGLPMFSVRLSLTVRLPRMTSSPPRKPTALARVLLVARRPLAVVCPAPLTVMLRSSSQTDESLSM